MTEQKSRLVIEIDSRTAERNASSLRAVLDGIDASGNDASKSVNKFEKSAKDASNSTSKLNNSARGLLTSLGGLKGVLGGLSGLLGASALIKTADAMQSLNSQVKLVTSSTAEFNYVQSELLKIANRQYSEIGALTGVYTSSRRALEQLGKTQSETLRFTENLAMAMRVGGVDAEAQANALRQLSQGLASGALRGDEFNSVAEQAPILLRLMSKELGVSQGDLRKLAGEGKITADVIYTALAGATTDLEEMASQMPVTVSQAMTVMQNNFSTIVGNLLNDTTGITGMIASVITAVANNLGNIVNILGAVAVAWGVYTVATSTAMIATMATTRAILTTNITLATMRGGLVGLASIIKAHPLMIIAGVIGGIAVATMGWQGALDSLSDAISVLGGLLSDFISGAVDGFGILASVTSDFLSGFSSNSDNAVNNSSSVFGVFFEGTAGGFVGLLQVVARVFDMCAVTIKSFAEYSYKNIMNFGTAVKNVFKSMGNFAISVAESIANSFIVRFNAIISLINTIKQAGNSIGLNLGENIQAVQLKKFERLQYDDVGYTQLNTVMAENVADQKANGLESSVTGVYNRINAKKAKKATDEATQSTNNLATASAKAGDAGAKALGKIATGATGAKSEVDEVTEAQEKLEQSGLDIISGLDRSIAMVGKNGEFEKWKYDLNDTNNELYKLSDTLKKEILDKSYELDVKLNQDKVKDIANTLQTALAKAQSSRLDSLAQVVMTPSEKAQWSLQNDQSRALGGAYNDYQANLDKINEEVVSEQDKHARLLQAEQVYQEQKHAIIQEYAVKEADLAKQQKDEQLSSYESLFGSMAGLTKTFAGEQSGAYRVMFGLEKAMAVARSMMAIQTGIAQASASPFPQNLLAMATVASQTAGIISTIKSIQAPSGIAHGGMSYVPKETTYLLDKGERVLSPNQNKDFTNFLSNQGASSGANIVINNNANTNVTAKQGSDGKVYVTVDELDGMVATALSRPNSKTSKSMQQNTNAGRRR